ncbi:hypothetical protein OOK58_02290 [Streptomyces sp. NBC_01728]|uniref:serine dehydratase beta chain n=1 Tax=unclassified Streptomyces TaxID=2593676 RepID=UPI00225560B0|nr:MULTISPECIES: serine dehydratase beta chain [unclassified Streptomyces]MCX4461513.1 hypothetical protein [Streptomyces sp. NBC_01719]MCX4490420.1 hypothetical protein [Streptomyces sp. NBC_01728]
MRAARRFVRLLDEEGLLPSVSRVRAELFGSLGATGHGHGSDKAVVLGFEDEDPATVDADRADSRVAQVRDSRTLLLAGKHRIGFDSAADLVLHRRRSLPPHANGMVFYAFTDDGPGRSTNGPTTRWGRLRRRRGRKRRRPCRRGHYTGAFSLRLGSRTARALRTGRPRRQ